MTTKHALNAFTRWRCLAVIGVVLLSLCAAGCGESATPPAGTTAKPTPEATASPSETKGKEGRPKVDVTSRREHQKQQTAPADRKP
jgi:hypothetical protein